ncbi:MAG: ATP-binding protein [Alphaproteobacteria bacterium]|nr:ATP-binding protein [Alphaproteobacteria bacterium]
MRIAVSGTHFMGKSTLIHDLIKIHPEYKYESEPYYQLEEQGFEFSLESTLECFLKQLDYSIDQLSQTAQEPNFIYDRCPVDFIAYTMYIADQEFTDINESYIAERFPIVKEALNTLDLIVFLPITKEDIIHYDEEDASYRSAVDRCFKSLYLDEVCDIFSAYDHPRIIEIWGDRQSRIKKINQYLSSPNL